MNHPVGRAKAMLEIEVHGRAPAGTLTAADGHPRQFAGWVELAAAIEAWRKEAPTQLERTAGRE